jgi:hypothetical protein
LDKEGPGVVDLLAHHPLPPPQLRRGVIFKAAKDLQLLLPGYGTVTFVILTIVDP